MKGQLNRKSLRYHWHEADVTVLEGIFAWETGGSRRRFITPTNPAVSLTPGATSLTRGKMGCGFEKAGLDVAFYAYRERNIDEILPWDFIDVGIRKDFLCGNGNGPWRVPSRQIAG